MVSAAMKQIRIFWTIIWNGFARKMLYDKEKEFAELLRITWSSSFFVIYSSGNPLSSLYNDLKVSDVKDHIVDYQSIARR